MNKTAVAVGLCLLGATSCFAQGGKMVEAVERGIKQARFVQKSSLSSVVNGYLRTSKVLSLTLSSGKTVRAVRFSRDIALKKENLLVPQGSLAVVTPEGNISVYGPEETVPAEIQEALDNAFYAEYPEFAEFAAGAAAEPPAAPSKPWSGAPVYNAQTDLARDIDAYYAGEAEEVLWDSISMLETKIYRVPSADIYYEPAGRAGRYLNPQEDLIFFHPGQNNGGIIFGGVSDGIWRMFFKAQP